jgi:hypothetical protein
MIQPGNSDESNLLGWLSHFKDMKATVYGSQTLNTASSYQGKIDIAHDVTAPKQAPPPIHGTSHSLRHDGSTSNQPSFPIHATSDSTPDDVTSPQRSTSPVHSTLDSTLQDTAVKEVYSTPSSVLNWSTVSSPFAAGSNYSSCVHTSSPVVAQLVHTEPRAISSQPAHVPVDKDNSSHSSPPRQLPLKNNSIHVDELLFFVQNKMETTYMDTIVSLVTEFYSDRDIENSKKMLYNSIQSKERYRKYRGENKAKENVKDICTIFYTTELQIQPYFVAKTLTKLPPITILDIGVGIEFSGNWTV